MRAGGAPAASYRKDRARIPVFCPENRGCDQRKLRLFRGAPGPCSAGGSGSVAHPARLTRPAQVPASCRAGPTPSGPYPGRVKLSHASTREIVIPWKVVRCRRYGLLSAPFALVLPEKSHPPARAVRPPGRAPSVCRSVAALIEISWNAQQRWVIVRTTRAAMPAPRGPASSRPPRPPRPTPKGLAPHPLPRRDTPEVPRSHSVVGPFAARRPGGAPHQAPAVRREALWRWTRSSAG